MTNFKDIINNYNNIILEDANNAPTTNIQSKIKNKLKEVAGAENFKLIENNPSAIEKIAMEVNKVAQTNNFFKQILINGNSTKSEKPKQESGQQKPSSAEQSTSQPTKSTQSAEQTDTTSTQQDQKSQKASTGKESSEKTDDKVAGDDAEKAGITYENRKNLSFNELYKMIMQQANDKKDEPPIPQSKPQQKKDQKGSSQPNKQVENIQKKMMEDAEHTVTLYVASKDSFDFYDNQSGQRIQSKETLKKIDNYIRLHFNQLQQQKEAIRQNKINAKNSGYAKAIPIISKQLEKDNLLSKIDTNKLLQVLNKFDRKLFNECTKSIAFGNGINREDYEKEYAVLLGLAICIRATTQKKTK